MPMFCERHGCNQPIHAAIVLRNREARTKETWYLCTQHYHDTVHVLKTLTLLYHLPISMHEKDGQRDEQVN